MLKQIVDIVLQAAKIMLHDEDFAVNEKDGVTNIVTTNDVLVQNFLQDKLAKLLPNSSFYCEENDVKDLSKDYIFIIDPIDGTTNYARHISVTAISVALEYKGEIIIGVIYNPYQKILFTAEKGKGAYLNNKRIHVSNHKFNEAVLYTAFSAYDKSKSDHVFDFQKKLFPLINDIRRTGSAAFEIASVAAGRGDMFFELHLNPWDYAAASLIIKEGGGYITSLKGDISLDHGCLIMAANSKENLDKLASLVRAHFTE